MKNGEKMEFGTINEDQSASRQRLHTRNIVLSAAGLAITYLLTLSLAPYPGQFLPKALPILLLAWYAYTTASAAYARWIAVGLIFSAIADMLLTRSDEAGFLAGVAVFGLAHCCYAASFWQLRKLGPAVLLRALPVLAAAVVVTWVLKPHLGSLAPAVFGYIGLICLAGVAAAALPSARKLAYGGMLLFMVSDATIAINRFVATVPAADYLIMTTYYLAQFLIVAGTVGFSRRAPQ